MNLLEAVKVVDEVPLDSVHISPYAQNRQTDETYREALEVMLAACSSLLHLSSITALLPPSSEM